MSRIFPIFVSGKIIKIVIKETRQKLFKIKREQTNLKSEKRIECLLLLKSKKFAAQELIAQYLGISRQTIVHWITAYNQSGILGILPPKTMNKKSKIFTAEIHAVISVKVKDSQNPLLGYWDAQNWVFENFGVQVNYQMILIHS